MSTMRICLVSQEFPPETARGGIGTQTWIKAHELAARGHEVHVLSESSSGSSEVTTREVDGFTVHRLAAPDAGAEVYGAATYWLGRSWQVFRHLTALHRERPFDLVDVPEYGAEGYVYQLDRSPWSWMPVVVQLHGPIAMFAERIGWPERGTDLYQVGSAMEGLSITRADGLMACSANIADFTSAFYEIPRADIDVVHTGVDTNLFYPAANGHAREPVILFAGNLTRSKGVETALEATLKLKERVPSVRLDVMGKADDDLGEELQARAQAAGAGNNVRILEFVGERDTLAEVFRQAAVFCSPAVHEVGVANVYLEAMASGLPVVAARTGGALEAVEHGETGMLVPPGDVEATAAALEALLTNNGLRHRMAEAGRQRVVEYFSTEPYIDRVLTTYERARERSQVKLAAAEAGHS